jgi:hypothetical protein
MLQPCAAKPLSRRARVRSTVASPAFKSRVLKPLHLNQVKEEGKEGKEQYVEGEDVEKGLLKGNRGEKRGGKKKGVIECQDHVKISEKSGKVCPKTKSTNTPMLVPTGVSCQSKASLSARIKDLRLKGADLYVARLGSNCKTDITARTVKPSIVPLPPEISIQRPSSNSRPSSSIISLHDELMHPNPLPSPSSTPPPSPDPAPEIRASRPCYRCVTQMHAVGIKRVFWTNVEGGWDGAKVRDLVDALDGSGLESENGDGGEGKGKGKEGRSGKDGRNLGVFVTKHEVLMLRRLMGG